MKANNINYHYKLRVASINDVKSIYQLSKQAQSGLSNIPKSLKKTKELLEYHEESINNHTSKKHHKFIFVLENKTGQIIGLSGIKSKTGIDRPHYAYLYKKNEPYPYLELTKRNLGPTEIGSLFISPDYRNKKLGKLLSLSRFLFIKSNPNLFTKTIIAELRGYFYNNNQCPVWSGIGKKFINLPFNEADERSINDPTFLPKRFPKKPIYTHLLSKKTQSYLGAIHPNTLPALTLLQNEQFKLTPYIDIFDGGPILECSNQTCRTINESISIKLNDIHTVINPLSNYLISTQSLTNFKCIKITTSTSLQQISDALDTRLSDNVWLIKE